MFLFMTKTQNLAQLQSDSVFATEIYLFSHVRILACSKNQGTYTLHKQNFQEVC